MLFFFFLDDQDHMHVRMVLKPLSILSFIQLTISELFLSSTSKVFYKHLITNYLSQSLFVCLSPPLFISFSPSLSLSVCLSVSLSPPPSLIIFLLVICYAMEYRLPMNLQSSCFSLSRAWLTSKQSYLTSCWFMWCVCVCVCVCVGVWEDYLRLFISF